METSRHKRMEKIWICESDRGKGEFRAEGTEEQRQKGGEIQGSSRGQWKRNVLVSLLQGSQGQQSPSTEKDRSGVG